MLPLQRHAYSYNYKASKTTNKHTTKTMIATHIQNKQISVYTELTKTENDKVLFGKRLTMPDILLLSRFFSIRKISVFTHSQISAYNSSVVNMISTKLKLQVYHKLSFLTVIKVCANSLWVGRNNGF